MRVAWFSPLPPARTEGASLAVELLAQTRGPESSPHLVDVFTSDEWWLPWARWTGTPTADLPYVRQRASSAETAGTRSKGRTVGGRGAREGARRDERPGETQGETRRKILGEIPGWHQAASLTPSAWRGPRTPAAPPGAPRLFRAWEFLFAEQHAPYDLKVYQLGNDAAHDFIWPYALRWPGLVFLQHADLHDARARRLLYLARPDDYRREFAFNHPGIDARTPEYVIAGLPSGPSGLWPMLRALLVSARGVIVHNPRLLEDLQEQFPKVPLRLMTLGVPDGAAARQEDTGSTVSAGEGALVVAALGPRLTPRLPMLIRAFAAVARQHPDARLLLLDEVDAALDAATRGLDPHIRARIEPRGYVPDAALAPHLAEATVAVAVRWPTWRETSTRWLRALAAGLPTLVTDEVNVVDVPLVEPIDWTLLHAAADAAATLQPPTWRDAVAVAVDVRREETMMREALGRLARDAPLRAALGANARRFWEARYQEARTHAELMAALDWAAQQPAPVLPRDFPPHLRAEGTTLVDRLLAELGVSTDIL